MAKGDDLESERLNDAAARRLLERATELDARLASESTVADLREAARAAGISEEAFQRALVEVRNEASPVAAAPAPPRTSSRRKVVLALIAALVMGAGLMLARGVPRQIVAEEAAPAAPVASPPPASSMPVSPPPEYHKPAPARAVPRKVPPR